MGGIIERTRNAPMTILFLHGSQSTPGGIKPTYLKDHGHTVLNPALSVKSMDIGSHDILIR